MTPARRTRAELPPGGPVRLGLAAAYVAAAWLGLHIALPPGVVTLVWPASGLAVAAVLLAGNRVWSTLWAGALIATLLLGFGDGTRWPTPAEAVAAVAIASGNTLEALVARRLLRRAGVLGRELDDPAGILAFLCAGAAACAVSATIGIATLSLGQWLDPAALPMMWLTWWLGDVTGVMVVTPLLLSWWQRAGQLPVEAGPVERWLYALVAPVLLATLYSWHPQAAPPFLYPSMLLQIWAAVRFSMLWTTTATCAIAALSVLLTAMGEGVFAAYASPQALLFLQGFTATCAVMALVLAALARSQRQALADLHQSAHRLQTVLDNVGAVIFLKDAQGRFQLVNRRFTAFLGLAPEQIIGRRNEDLLPPDIATAMQVHEVQAVAHDRPEMFDATVPGAQGPTTFLAVVFPLRRPDGTLEGVCGVGTDITARRESERQQQLIEALQQADTLKNQFLSIVSHELRTPLTVIKGYTAILQRGMAGPLNQKQQTYLQKVQRAADSMLRLIGDLLDMGRILAGRFTVRPQPTDTAAVVAATLTPLALLARQQGVTLVQAVPADTPWVQADPQRLGQVLANLVGNALKFTPAGGTIRVTAERQGAMLRVAVSDTGAGIPADKQRLLFQRFTQLDMSANRQTSGAGLGLSICKEIVQAHGGTIGVASAPGRGSTFWFTLPITAVRPAPPEQEVA